MKLAIVFDGLGFGGIERVGLDYAKMAIKLGYTVDIYNLNPKYDASVKNLPEGVNHYYGINFPRRYCPELYSYGVQKWVWGKYAYCVLSPVLSLFQTIRKLFSKRRKYDVAISMAGHINDLSFVVKNFIKSDKKIVWCHGNLLSYLAICDAYPILYKKVDKIVTLSSAAQKDAFPGKKFLYSKQITKMYNPTYIREKEINYQLSDEIKNKYGDFILMIARIEHQKGHDIAIKALKKLHEKGVEANLVFLGDGPAMDDFKKFAIETGVDKYCFFEGSKYNVGDYINACYVNLLTSRWEGLPTVMIEGMSFGKPCVMTNTDDGEVSGSGKYCLVNDVDDYEGIADSLYKLYSNKKEYDRFCDLSTERAKAFDPKMIESQFKDLVEK